MAQKAKEMTDIKKILKLRFKGLSPRKVGKLVQASKNTVEKYFLEFTRMGHSREDLENFSDSQIYDMLLAPKRSDEERLLGMEALFPGFAKELLKVGMNRKILWEGYIEQDPDGYGYSQFCRHFRVWQKAQDVTMHFEHKAGDKLFVDFAGERLCTIDPATGERIYVETFVACMGGSKATYVEFIPSQRVPDFIKALNNALRFFGGVPSAIVTDNLKSAVIQVDRYEPLLNTNFEAFCAHYGCAGDPTRAMKPRDKALVENAVKLIYSAIYVPLNKHTFFSLKQLNDAAQEYLDAFNSKPLTGLTYSRRDILEEVERKALSPLPTHDYTVKMFGKGRVSSQYHIFIKHDNCYYSVPYTYTKKKVNWVVTATTVEFFHRHTRIALHLRNREDPKVHILWVTDPEHLPNTHRYVKDRSREFFMKQGDKVGPHTVQYFEGVFEKCGHSEVAYKQCEGILKFGKEGRFGPVRLENACKRALRFGSYSAKCIEKILKSNSDMEELNEHQNTPIPAHHNIRGEFE